MRPSRCTVWLKRVWFNSDRLQVSGNVLGTLVVALNVSIILVPIFELVMLCGHLTKSGQNKRALNPVRLSLHVRSERMIENPTKSGNLVRPWPRERKDWSNNSTLRGSSCTLHEPPGGCMLYRAI